MKSNYLAGRRDVDKKALKWDMNSEAAKLLKEGLENGDIDPNKTPKSVHKNRPLFEQYNLSKFCLAYNKIKKTWDCICANKLEEKQIYKKRIQNLQVLMVHL